MYEWPFTYYSLTPCSGKLQRVAIREMKNLRTIHCKSFKLWINCNNYDFVCPEIPAEQHPIRHNVGEGKREIPESIESTPPPPPSTEIKEASKKQKRMRQRKEKDQIPSERLNGYDARPKSWDAVTELSILFITTKKRSKVPGYKIKKKGKGRVDPAGFLPAS